MSADYGDYPECWMMGNGGDWACLFGWGVGAIFPMMGLRCLINRLGE